MAMAPLHQLFRAIGVAARIQRTRILLVLTHKIYNSRPLRIYSFYQAFTSCSACRSFSLHSVCQNMRFNFSKPRDPHKNTTGKDSHSRSSLCSSCEAKLYIQRMRKRLKAVFAPAGVKNFKLTNFYTLSSDHRYCSTQKEIGDCKLYRGGAAAPMYGRLCYVLPYQMSIQCQKHD